MLFRKRYTRRATCSLFFWIPAFAGMTKNGVIFSGESLTGQKTPTDIENLHDRQTRPKIARIRGETAAIETAGCCSLQKGRLPTYRIAAYALATAAMAIVVIVWLTPQPQPLSVLPQIEPTIVTVVTVSKPFQTTSPITSPTMRQQLAELLDEMNVSDPIAEEKPNYPVVEIVVCDAPPKPTMPLPFERPWFRGVMEQEMLFMF